MKWDEGHRSENVEDRRGQTIARRGTTIGLGGLLVLGVLSLLLKRDLLTPVVVGTQGGNTPQSVGYTSGPTRQPTPEENRLASFVAFVLDDTQDTWRRVFADSGRDYPDAHLVLFDEAVDSACGFAEAAMGPFYCPRDSKVYIDLSFYRELHDRFGAPGDFAQAYVLAHEIGHHVQNVLGTETAMRESQRRNPRERNELSVRLELQADCYAGIWAHGTSQRGLLDPGDIEEAMNAAQKIGDDALQRAAGRRVQPESFTHGTSAQRAAWFQRGYSRGQLDDCDTFATAE